MVALRTSLLLTCLALLAVQAQKAPRFKVCPRKLPAAKLNECVLDSLQKAVPELVKGLPDYGLATIDPLRVESLIIPRNKGAVSVDISFKNLDIIGLKNIKIKSVDLDVDNLKMKVKLDIIGNVELQGDYKINGKVLVLPIQGEGRCNITLVNPQGEITDMTAKPVTRNGKQYVQVTKLDFRVYNVDKVYYYLENLFNGNKELGDNMNLVLNDNWKQIFEDMVGPVQNALGLAFKTIANGIGNKVPFNSVFV